MIPVNQVLITKKDALSVYNVVKSGWVSSGGKKIIEFEGKLKKYIGKKYCSLVANGTAALEIAVKSLDLKKGDEIITPNFTIISNALSIIKQDLKPVFIDCDINNWNMKIDDIEKSISKRTKAIMAVHIYGYPLEIDKIAKICKKYNLYLIEDASEMLGHKFKRKLCGSFGHISTFSFYANKHITTGEGGAILTNLKILDKKIKKLRNLSFGKNNRYNHDDIGWNYRFTNMQAALGLSQLDRINSIIKKKIKIGKSYYSYLKNNKNIYIQKPMYNNIKNVYWVVGILIKNKKISANIIRSRLKKLGVETRAFFWPMNRQKILKKIGFKFRSKFPNSEYLSRYGFYLPSGLGITSKQIKIVSTILIKLLNNKKIKV
jgi:perosamine synthetase